MKSVEDLLLFLSTTEGHFEKLTLRHGRQSCNLWKGL
jgi:hypothetical protein